MKNSHLILPIQKVVNFQYQSKTPLQKCYWWLVFYKNWSIEWSIFLWLLLVKQMIHLGKTAEKEYIKLTGKRLPLSIYDWLEGANAQNVSKNISVPESIQEYMDQQYLRWSAMAKKVLKERTTQGTFGNSNIDSEFYSEEEFKKMYTDWILEENIEKEKRWKERILTTWVPMIGNVVMFYDAYRMGFVYYCDTQGVNYNVINACVMQYVTTFHCMDLFMDEFLRITLDEKMEDEKEQRIAWNTPLVKIQKVIDDFHLNNDDQPNHRDIYAISGNSKKPLKGAELFAKFKQYRVENIPSQQMKIRNKIIYKGRIRDFKPIQSLDRKVFINKEVFKKVTVESLRIENSVKTSVPKIGDLILNSDENNENLDLEAGWEEDLVFEEEGKNDSESDVESLSQNANPIEKILYPQNEQLLDWEEVKKLDGPIPREKDQPIISKTGPSESISYSEYKKKLLMGY